MLQKLKNQHAVTFDSMHCSLQQHLNGELNYTMAEHPKTTFSLELKMYKFNREGTSKCVLHREVSLQCPLYSDNSLSESVH